MIYLGHILNCHLIFQVWETRRNSRGEEATYQGSSEETRRSEGAHWQIEVEREERMERGGGRGDCSVSVSSSSSFGPLDVSMFHTAVKHILQQMQTLHCTECVYVCVREGKRDIQVQMLSPSVATMQFYALDLPSVIGRFLSLALFKEG